MARGYVGGITVADIATVMDDSWIQLDAWTYHDRLTGRRFEITSNSAGYVETLYYQGQFHTETEVPLNGTIRKILRRMI